jgi:hypothetical protein
MKEWEGIGRIRAVDRVAARRQKMERIGLQRVGMLRVICRWGKGRRVLQKTIVRLLQMRFEQA